MKKIILFGTLLFCIFTFLPMTGCSKSPDLTDYVSEYRSDLFSGTNGEYSVFATCSKREYPYAADGNVGDISDLFEVALTVPDNHCPEYSFWKKAAQTERHPTLTAFSALRSLLKAYLSSHVSDSMTWKCRQARPTEMSFR